MSAQEFFPPRQRGLALHAGLTVVLLIVSVLAFSRAIQEDVGPAFTVSVLVGTGTLLVSPFLVYRFYALQRARYLLDRDALVLSWGLRLEQLPLDEIEWVRPAYDLTTPLAVPPLSLPGAVLGLRHHPDLGPVEFLASERRGLLLVATARRVFAISPADISGFVREFQRAVELGSLEHPKGRSVYPSFVIARAWENRAIRFLWLSGLLLNLGLLGWVSVLIPTLSEVHLGFSPSGQPFAPVPASQLIILPLVSLVLFAAGWLAGLFYYRLPERRLLSFIVWGASAITALLFVLAAWINLSLVG